MPLATPTVLLGFPLFGHGVSLHRCSSKVQLLLLTLDEGYLLTAAPPDLERGVAPLGRFCITMNKASGGDGIPVELYQILKDDAVKVLHSICQQFGNSAVATGLEKVSFHSNPKERQCQRMLKLPHNRTHLTH